MAKQKLIILILAIAAMASAGCGNVNKKGRIAATVRGYVERDLGAGESFGFVGLTNRRDTVFMGSTHPCAGVIYTITDNVSGRKTRHLADVIFSDDYTEALNVQELDTDPVGTVEDRIRGKLSEKLFGPDRK